MTIEPALSMKAYLLSAFSSTLTAAKPSEKSLAMKKSWFDGQLPCFVHKPAQARSRRIAFSRRW
jgi:hypothetical protein